jgi:hypothetical protein
MTTKLTKANPGPMLADAMEVTWYKTSMRMYAVSDSQLEELVAGYNSLHLVCFGICFGAAITLLVAFTQTALTASEKPYYFVGMIAAFGLSAFFGINGIVNCVKAYRRKAKLYKESVPLTPPS